MGCRSIGIGVVTTGLIFAASVSAHADGRIGGGGGDDGTYTVNVEVVYSGDAAPGNGRGGTEISVPARCWWNQFSFDGAEFEFPNGNIQVPPADGTDAKAMAEWREQYAAVYGRAGSGNEGFYYSVPSAEWFEAQVAREEAGTDLTFYTPTCLGGWDELLETEYTEIYPAYGGIPILINAWPVAQDPPAPLVDPEELAIRAQEDMVIDEPEIDRNPKVEDIGGGTFVDFPTWFWVTNPDSVGGDNGTRTIRADIVGSPVYAEVTARTGGLSVAAPGAGTFCSPSESLVEWAPGADSSCVIQFPRASHGYPITASTAWNASWEGQTHDGEAEDGVLEPMQRSAPPVNVPVAEVQTIVQPGL